MPNWKKVIVSGSDAILNSITSSAGISSSGDIYAPNFIGTASIASKITITSLNNPAFFDVLFTNGSNLFLTDSDTSDFAYNPSTNTLLVDNIIGTASLATDAVSASYAGNGVDISGNVNNRVLTATGNNILQGEGNLTFDGTTLSSPALSLNANDPLTVSSQAGNAFTVEDSSGNNVIKIGDISGGQNETLLTVNDTTTKITFYTNGVSSELNGSGFKTAGNVTASLNISASGDLRGRDLDVSRDVKPGRNIVVPVDSKIGTPNGIDINDDYILFGNDSARNISFKFDNDSLFKVDFTNELITLKESTKHGNLTNDTHQFTGSVDIKGNTNIDGNLIIDGDLTAQQYIVNSTVTNVTMSFSSGSTIFGDSTDDTHLFTGSVDITGSANIVGPLSLPGFSDVSASLANLTAGGGADNLGDHTATTDLNLDGNSIKNILNVTASGNISASGELIIGGDLNLDLGNHIRFSNQLAITKENNGELKLYGGTNGTDGGFELFTWNGAAYDSSFTLKNDRNATFAGTVTSTNITASGNISASGNLNADHLILNPNTTTTGSSDTDAAIDISLGEESYKSGVIKRVFDFRENIPSADTININEQVIADVGEFTKGTFELSLELKGVRHPDTTSIVVAGTGSIHQSINLSGQTTNVYAIGSAVDVVYSESGLDGDSGIDVIAEVMLGIGTNYAPSGNIIASLSNATQPPFLRVDSGKLKLNFGQPANVDFSISGSLATVFLNYQLYK